MFSWIKEAMVPPDMDTFVHLLRAAMNKPTDQSAAVQNVLEKMYLYMIDPRKLITDSTLSLDPEGASQFTEVCKINGSNTLDQ